MVGIKERRVSRNPRTTTIAGSLETEESYQIETRGGRSPREMF